ncbi:MAG TPA: HAMP domain-containing sensor histidine kinase [Polyangia bacterium]
MSESVTEEPSAKVSIAVVTARRSLWRALGAWLFGDPSSVDLDHSALRGIMLLVVVTGLFSTIQNNVIGASRAMLAITIVSTIAGALGYWQARRTHRWRALRTTIFVFFLGVLCVAWILQAGSYGTIGYYYFLLIFYAVAFFKGAGKIASLALTAATIASLLFVESLLPGAIQPYARPSQRFADVAFALPFCLLMVSVFFHVVYGAYQRERTAKDNLLRLVTEEKDRVERSMRQKQRLLSVVCHDIANALTVLQGEISLVRYYGKPDPSTNPATLDRMDYACGNIGEIIGSVRMMEAVEQGLIQFSPMPVDLRAVFKNAEVLFGERLAKRRMRLEFPQLADEDRFVMAEAKILANHVFNNLISNAIRFSYPESSIVVTVTRESGVTTLSVADRGIGMPPDLRAKLFDFDAKTTRPGTDGEPGTGFGMRTMKSFVDLFGGEIEVSSRAEASHPQDHGTTVSIRLKSGSA